MIHLPSMKTKGSDGDDIYLMECPFVSSPISVFEHHLASNPLVPDDAPLFAWQTAKGGLCPMNKGWFMDRCRKLWEKEGLVLFDGHSF